MTESSPPATRPCPAAGRLAAFALLAGLLLLSGCESLPEAPLHPEPGRHALSDRDYRIAPGDRLTVFVWQDRDLSLTVPVRPDGRISLPLVGDVVAAGRMPSELSRELEQRLAAYVQDPVVTVILAETAGPIDRRVRVVGQATRPQSLPWRPGMTVLDAVIEAGGLTEFADGNRAVLVRRLDGEVVRYRLRLEDLLQDGDITANAELLPGDVVIVPETVF